MLKLELVAAGGISPVRTDPDLVIFGSIPKSNFWHVFYVFLDLVILHYFNAISMDFYAVKCLIYIYFV